jgi:hypothetical protein
LFNNDANSLIGNSGATTIAVDVVAAFKVSTLTAITGGNSLVITGGTYPTTPNYTDIIIQGFNYFT